MKILILKLVGAVSLSLGVLGAFLPLLPSTCFILLATWAFSKSSPRFHTWLVVHSPFAESINNWQQHRVIPKKVKLFATLSIMVSFAFSAWLISNPTVITLLAGGSVILLAYMLTRNSEEDINQPVTQLRNYE